jgi:Acetyl-CoA carboxylase, central region
MLDIFVRAVIRSFGGLSFANDAVGPIPEAKRTSCEALDAVDIAICDSRIRTIDYSHITLNVIPTVRIDVEDMQEICRRLFVRYSACCNELHFA